MKKRNNTIAFIIRYHTLALLLFNSATLYASRLEVGEDLIIKEDISEDLYLAAEEVHFSGELRGDINVAGGEITVSGSISQDAAAAGGTIHFDADVMDDAKILGGQVDIKGEIKGDLLVAGGYLVIHEEARIGGDLYIAGGNVKVLGRIEGSLYAAGGDLLLSGGVGRDLTLRGGEAVLGGEVLGESSISANRLTLKPSARFHSALNYWSEDEVDFSPNMAGGAEARFDHELQPEGGHVPDFFMFFIFSFLLLALFSSLITLYVLNRFLEAPLSRAAQGLRGDFLKSLGSGVLYFIFTPILILLLFITVIALPFGILAAAIYGVTILFIRPAAAVIAAHWLQQRSQEPAQWSFLKQYMVSFGLYLGFVFLFFIPILGWAVSAILIAASAGSIINLLVAAMRAKKSE